MRRRMPRDASRSPFWSARRPCASRRRCFCRARTRINAPPAVPATTPAAASRAQRLGSRRALGSNSASSPTAASVSAVSRRSRRSVSAPGGSTGANALCRSRSTSLILGFLLFFLEALLELSYRAMNQDLGGTFGPPQRTCDLAVVHPDREAHDQGLAPVVRQSGHTAQHGLDLLALLHDLLGAERRRDDRGVLQVRLRAARAVAVVVRREVVGDADQPGPQRASVRLRARPCEVAVGLKERLLRQVLGVVVVADPVVAVAVHVAEVGAVQLGELAVELRLVHGRCHACERTPTLLAAPAT